ncbi:MAG TPA: hypothetical protein VEX15_16585 [Nocardioidaceae bacterium]|nr:hypothetical protein [Nocardioidaceae bacterium]
MPVEEILSRELREVADGLPVPALPPLPQEPPDTRRHWPPLLVAAAVVLIVAGAVAVALSRDDAPPAPTPDPVETPTVVRSLTPEAPTVPYVFDDKLYVDGEQVPGSWWEVSYAGDAWVAERNDLTMQWGTDAEPHDFPGELILQPHLSPDGTLLAVSTTADGGQVLLIDTQSGETVNALPTDADGSRGGNDIGVVAVTDDAKVFLDSDAAQLTWLAADGDETVELAPGQFPLEATPAGLIVLDSTRDDAAYLADVADSGEINRLRPLPGFEIVINPSGTWLAYGGSWGGESQTIPEITAQPVDAGRQLKLQPPDKRTLVPMTWEDDDLLLAALYDDGDPTGLARCSIRDERCVVIDLR